MRRAKHFIIIASIPLALASVSTVAAGAPPGDGNDQVEQYIVQVEDRAALRGVVADVAAEGAEIGVEDSGPITFFTADLDGAAAEELRGAEGVVAVELDRTVEISGVQDNATWGLDRIDQRNLPLNTRYSYRDNGAGVDVYVLDTGIRPTHTDFTGRIPRGHGVAGEWVDCQGHGTHVSGTVAGTTWGVAKRANIIPVKVFPGCTGSTPTSNIILGMNWAIQDHAAGRPAAANMSLGGPADSVMDNAAQAMVNDGITLVVAAGNNFGSDACFGSPARFQGAITVAASDSGDLHAQFSNSGPCVDLYAPGAFITSADAFSDTGGVIFSGTSMASPHVAGAAALVLQRSPRATPAQVWAAIDNDTTRGVVSEFPGTADKLLHISPEGTAARPSAPRSLRGAVAPAGRVRSGQVRLSWNVPSTSVAAVTDYVIQRATLRGGWQTVNDRVWAARAYTVSGLTNGREYRFRVAAKNAAGVGAWSATIHATPRWEPTAPRNLGAAVAPRRGVDSGQVRLSWSGPRTANGARVTDYVIQRASGRRWITVRDGVSTARIEIVGRLHNGTQYRFRVAAKNAVGRGPWSSIVRATPHR